MKIWAHRGCSQRYPENTLLAFEKASELEGLTGIELDIQMTRDGEIVVCHDERIDRTTDGIGELREYTLKELKKQKIEAGENGTERIPTIDEVLDLLEGRLKEGLKLNIELKNSSIRYEGMEEKIIKKVAGRGFERQVVYSSFYAHSLERIKELEKEAQTAILDRKVSDCLYKLRGGCGADALHPYWGGMDLPGEKVEGYVVRAWFSGHLYPEKPSGGRLDLEKLRKQGITDVIINEPEEYL